MRRRRVTVLDRPPSRVSKLAARLALGLYDVGLGRLLGHHFLVLTHQGRRSGRTYRTMLEIILWAPERREAIVAAGWGEHANWYRNILSAPARQIQIGKQRFVPEQRFLDLRERIEVLRAYRQKHPLATKALGALLGLRLDDLHAVATRLPMIAFQPGPE